MFPSAQNIFLIFIDFFLYIFYYVFRFVLTLVIHI